jgi:hypothetical protein
LALETTTLQAFFWKAWAKWNMSTYIVWSHSLCIKLPDGYLIFSSVYAYTWSALEWKMFKYFVAVWNILWPSGIFMVICYLHVSPFWHFVQNMSTPVSSQPADMGACGLWDRIPPGILLWLVP